MLATRSIKNKLLVGYAVTNCQLRTSTDALSVEVRPPWYNVGDTPADPDRYKILLTTGGPAVRIIGELNSWLEPETAELEVQDWFQPWQSFPTSKEDDEALMQYASCFAYVS